MRAISHDWTAAPAMLRPAADEVHVWTAALDRTPAEAAALSRHLSQEERDRAERFRHAGAREEFDRRPRFVASFAGQMPGA